MTANFRNLQGRDKNREIIRALDNYTCQDCGKVWKQGERRFDIHHTNGECGQKSRKYDKLTDVSRLITLCHKCHFKRHDFSKKMKTMKKKLGGRPQKDHAPLILKRNSLMIQLLQEGFTRTQVAYMFGVHPAQVVRLLEERPK